MMNSLRASLPRHGSLSRKVITPNTRLFLNHRPVITPALNHARTLASSSSRSEPGSGRVTVTDNGGELSSRLNHENIERHTLPSFWLRDNCRCSQCVNQDTMQRNFNTFDIPPDIQPKEIAMSTEGINIIWPDGHESTYDRKFLQTSGRRRGKEDEELGYFGSREFSSPPFLGESHIPYDRVMLSDDKGVGELTARIKKYGFAFVRDTPCDDPAATKELLERIAFIRVTHYGGFYDFTPDLAMADTAYTNIALPAHTDTTYFTDPAGLQAFHLLSHKGGGESEGEGEAEGGRSLLVDGFNAARTLLRQDPKAHEVLSKVRLPWHASGNEGITISPDKRYPVLELDEDTGELHRVRWNNDDRGVVPFGEEFTPEEWYEAARKWDKILRSEEMQCWVQLRPGTTLIFDNWRVLHGRSAFTGIRRICGGYINRDDFVSRWRNTNFPRQEILDRIIG